VARNPHLQTELYVPVDARPTGDDAGLPRPRYFPPPGISTADGLVCVGGCLEPEWLLDAYRHGIFPWPSWPNEPIPWWSPVPRGVLELDGLYVSRRLARTLRQDKFTATCNQSFSDVIHGCATAVGRRGNTWLNRSMIAAYCRMHQLRHAHSIEVWHAGRLAGGIYGLAIGGFFAAESKFHTVTDASKVALAYLVAHLRARGYQLLDVQQQTAHTAQLGVVEISRRGYLRRLAECIDLPASFGDTLCGNVMELTTSAES
jgi:leucyl/phenylalanyl-tRNA---protein transferase